MTEINLDNLDAALLAEIDEQLRDGLITQAEADKLRKAIQGGGTRRIVDNMLGDHAK